MDFQFSVLCQILIFLTAAQPSIGGYFEYVLDDESVFSECFNTPPGYANISGLFDVSTVNFEMGPEGVHIDGHVTSTWDIQPTDRIEGRLNVVHMDRGTWQPTVLNMVCKDFCKTFLDPNQYWYNVFPKHIINKDEARQKCLNYKGVCAVQCYSMLFLQVFIYRLFTSWNHIPYKCILDWV